MGGFRAQSVCFGEDLWWEHVPGFIGANTNKRDLTLDKGNERGRELARELIARSDVLIDNFTCRVLEQWGSSSEELKDIKDYLIMVRAPAFGIDGPWRDRVGCAQTLEQVSGMAWLTGWPDRQPEMPSGLLDPIAGTHATIALLLALAYRRRTGKGALIEAPWWGRRSTWRPNSSSNTRPSGVCSSVKATGGQPAFPRAPTEALTRRSDGSRWRSKRVTIGRPCGTRSTSRDRWAMPSRPPDR
jgi:hypothetical protein